MEAETQCFISTTAKYPGYTEVGEEPDMEKIDDFARLINGLCKQDNTVFVYKIRANQDFYNVLGLYEASKTTELYRKNEMAIEQCIRYNAHEDEVISIQKISSESIHSAWSWTLFQHDEGFRPDQYYENEKFDSTLIGTSNGKPFEKII